MFRRDGFDGTSCEGGLILTIIKGLCLDVLADLNTFKSRDDACTRFVEAQLTIHASRREHILACIAETPWSIFERNIEEICAHSFTRTRFPGVQARIALRVAQSLGRPTIEAIAHKLADDPYCYRRGWPDLTLVREGEVRFVEVKTRDRLGENQIVTIQAMGTAAQLRFSVVQLVEPTTCTIVGLGG
jgi:hypothetical protein